MNKLLKPLAISLTMIHGTVAFAQICPADPRCLNNPYGAGSPYKSDGLMNPYSEYGSAYSNKSWNNPYATNAPKVYDQQGNYRGRLSSNPYDPDSISNPNGAYGNPSSPLSVKNRANTSPQPLRVVPQNGSSFNESDFEYFSPGTANPTVGQVLVGAAIVLGVMVIKAVVSGIIEAVNSSPSPLQGQKLANTKALPSDPASYIRQNNLSGADANRIGNWYLYSNTEKNPALAYKYLVFAADHGQAQASFTIATMYRDGNGVQKNVSEAVKYFKQSADEGYLPAQVVLGDLYFKGTGVEKNQEQALKYYLLGARGGDTNAMAAASAMYRIGMGTEIKPSLARKLATESSNRGNLLGTLQLSIIEFTGVDGAPDFARFFELSLKAAASKQPIALANLGYAYESGIGTEPDIKKAVVYYKEAADQKIPSALMALARINETGAAGTVNREEAARLYAAAAGLGVPGAKTKEMLARRQLEQNTK